MKKDFVKRTLSNGIIVYLYADKNLKRTIASYNVSYGTLGYYDKFYYREKLYSIPPAIAHFLEHTIVETSKKGNMLHRFKEKNYEVNAVTYSEVTSYYFIGIKDTMESIRELIEMVDDPGFDRENIEKVKAAVCEESVKTLDNKYGIAYNANKRNAFKAFDSVHESYSVLGNRETTNSITYEDVKVCYDAYYNDENKFLVIGGNFDVDEMVEYLESIYADLPRHPNEMKPVDYGDLIPIRKPYEELVRPVAMDHVIESFKIRNDFGLEKVQIDLYLLIFFRLKFAGDTKFMTELANDKIIVGRLGHSFDFFHDVITISLSADVLNQEEFLRRVEGELNSDNLDERMFELIRKSLKVNELSKMDYIYKSILRFPTIIDFTDKLYVMDMIDKFTIDDLRKFIDKLDWSIKTVTVLKKEEAKEKVD